MKKFEGIVTKVCDIDTHTHATNVFTVLYIDGEEVEVGFCIPSTEVKKGDAITIYPYPGRYINGYIAMDYKGVKVWCSKEFAEEIAKYIKNSDDVRNLEKLKNSIMAEFNISSEQLFEMMVFIIKKL